MAKVEMLSDVGADYTRLRNFLAAGDWLNADEETARLVLMAVGKEENGFLRDQDIEKFPYTDLGTLDFLWRYYSADRFGFSIQSYLWDVIIKKNLHGNYLSFAHLGFHLGWLTDKGWLKLHESSNNIRL